MLSTAAAMAPSRVCVAASASQPRCFVERRHSILTQPIEFTHGHEHAFTQSGDIHGAQCICSFAETTKLLPQLCVVQRAFRSRSQGHFAFHGDTIATRRKNDLERTARVTEHTGIHTHTRTFGRRNIRKTFLRARHQRRIKRAYDAPTIRHTQTRRQRLPINTILHIRACARRSRCSQWSQTNLQPVLQNQARHPATSGDETSTSRSEPSRPTTWPSSRPLLSG